MTVKNKISWTVLGMASLLTMLGTLAVNRQYAVATAAAIKEAENVARVIGFLLSDGTGLTKNAQDLIVNLNQVEKRDVVLVDHTQRIVADAVAADIGKYFTEDPLDEVGATLQDGRPRTFVEISSDSPLPIKQIVLPVHGQSGRIIGAVVLEYTTLYDELMGLTRTTARLLIWTGLASLVVAVLLSLYLGRSISAPLRQLTNAATGFAHGRVGLPVPARRDDEIGELTVAFNDMVQKRQRIEEEIRVARDDMEIRVEERTADLAQTNAALLSENTERRKVEAELRGKTALLEAQINSSIDGILVVDEEKKLALQNQRLIDLLNIPPAIANETGDQTRLQWVEQLCKYPEQFLARVKYLYEHPDEVSRDEMELVDGTVLDRYSAPVRGRDGKYYGRIWTFRDITERKQTERSLRLLGSAVEQAGESIVITDAELDLPGPRIVFVNPAYTRLTGFTAAEALGQTPRISQGPRTDKGVLLRLRQTLAKGETFQGEAVNYRKDGTEYDLEWQIAPLRNADGKVENFVAIQRDVTARKRMEAQLADSRKMETVGKLAGGVAHEFNSILTAIIGQTDLLLVDLPAENALVRNATEIRKAALRAAALTRQLLAYGRKQFLQPNILELNQVISNLTAKVRHLLGRTVDLLIVTEPRLHKIKVDGAQIEEVIMNMVANAREAMPQGGKLTIETANISLDQEFAGHFPELTVGEYVTFSITDTGMGMKAEVKARVFEPFFSTKGVREGAGLGLATCYGIIKQSGGHITVYSEPGRGTTFRIYLPRADGPLVKPVARAVGLALPGGTESILLVEDDPALREMATTLLRRLGYTVWAAANGIDALELTQRPDTGPIDLLFTDIAMPHLSGSALAEQMRALSPRTRILFTSAYTANAIVHQGVLSRETPILQKPFTPSALAHKLREVLAASTLKHPL